MVGLASANGVRWVSLIEPHIEDDIIRAQMFATGGYAGIASGHHDITRSWEGKALALAAGRDPFALVLAGCLRAAPLMLSEPDEALGCIYSMRSMPPTGARPRCAASFGCGRTPRV